VTDYFLTNNISGAWIGHFFANMERWEELPEDLKTLVRVCFDSSHYYRQWWYWGGEAALRVNGEKMELTSIPDSEWAQVEEAAKTFWDELAGDNPVRQEVVAKIREYNDVMQAAGRPYRYGSS
jgi:TRAP-type mannitol/chloroaromatic compound transport system substrate-binding protein